MEESKRTILSDYYELIVKYKGLAEAAQKELNECKQEMRQMKADIMNRINDGQYLWDSKRIVISAPEIIIGNVTKNGELIDGGKVLIVGNTIGVNGAGPAGSIIVKAPAISQIAVNPGNDGTTDIVEPISTITNIARNIHIDSQSPKTAEGYGATFIPTGSHNGVSILSDSNIHIAATQSHKTKKDMINKYKKTLEDSKKDFSDSIDPYLADMMEIKTRIELEAGMSWDLAAQDDLTKTNILALDELNSKAMIGTSTFLREAYSVSYNIASLAEYNRKIACLQKELEEIDKVDDDKFKKDSTKTGLRIESENISILSSDGDGTIRTNPEAGILVQGNNISLKSLTEQGKLTPTEAKGSVSINSRNINLMTYDIDSPVYDNGNLKSAKYPVVGTVNISSKKVNVTAMDLEQTDKNKYKEAKLTEGSEVNIRAEKVKVKTINEQGKSVGKFSVNSQKISMKSTDIKEYKPEIELDDQGNHKPKEMHSEKVAADSEMLLLSNKINIGFKKEKITTNRIDLYSKEDCNLLSEKKIAMGINKESDDSSSAGIMVTDSMTKVFNTKKTRIMGKGGITVNGETSFESKVKGKTVEVENLNASKAVKAPNITDGILIDGSAPGEDPKENVQKNKSTI